MAYIENVAQKMRQSEEVLKPFGDNEEFQREELFGASMFAFQSIFDCFRLLMSGLLTSCIATFMIPSEGFRGDVRVTSQITRRFFITTEIFDYNCF